MSGSQWQWPVVDPEAPQYGGDTDQIVADAQRRANDLKFRLGGLLPGAVASVLPDQQAPGVLGYVPLAGAAASQIKMGTGVADLVDSLQQEMPVLKYLPVPVIGMGGLPHAQDRPDDSTYQRALNWFYPTTVANWANRVDQQNRTRAEGWIPHPDPATVGEREALDWGEGVGSLGLPITKIPGAVGRVLESALPAIAKGVAPGLVSAHAPAMIAGMSAGGEALQDATRMDDPSRPLTPPAPPVPVEGTSPSGLTFGEPVVGTPPPDSGLIIPHIPPPTFDNSTPPPDFLNLGASDHTIGNMLRDVGMGIMLVAGARFAARLGASYTDAARQARYAQDSASFNSDLLRRSTNPGDTSTLPGLDAPLPPAGGVIAQAAMRAKTQLLDTNAQAKAYVDATADPATPDVSADLKAQIGNVYNDGRYQSRIGEVMRAGVHERTGITFPSFEQYSNNVSRLDPVRQDAYDKMIQYANELDDRTRMQRTAPTTSGPAPESRYNFDLVPTSELQAHIAATMADPELASLRNIRTMIMNGGLDVAKADGFITPTDYARVKAEHPNYLSSSDESGSILHTFGERTLTPGEGIRTANTQSWELDKQHLMSLYREIELNATRRALVEHGLDYQGRNPDAAKVFTIETMPNGEPRMSMNSGLVPLRYSTGVRSLGIHNPDLRNWMMESEPQLHSMLNATAYAKNLYQQGTTGFWALADQRFFPLTNIARTGVQMATNRELPFSGGLIDKGVQHLSGGRFGYTGPDPTTLGGIPYSLGADMTSSLAHGLSYVFDYTARNPMNKALRAMIGDNAVNAMSQAFRDKYLGSQLSERRGLGINNQGGAALGEVPRSQIGTQGGLEKKTFAEINNMVPQLYRAYGTMGWAVPTYVRMTRLAKQMFDLSNNASTAYMYRLNRGNPNISRERLADHIADISGDPGIMGRSKFAQAVASMPYTNVTAQGIRRQGEAFANNPVGSVGGIGMHLVSLALGSVFSAYLMGPDAIKDLQEDTSLTRRASFPKLYLPSGPIEISLDQNLRGPYAIALDMATAALGAADAHKGEDAYKFGMGVLNDFWDHHITNSAIKSAETGLTQIGDPFLQVPMWGNVASVLSGNQQLSPSMYSLLERSPTAHAVVPEHTPPNYVPDAFLDSNVGKIGRALVSIIAGAATGVFDMATVGERAARAGAGPGGVVSAMGDNWWQGFKDNNPMLNGVLWNNNIRPLSSQGAVAGMVAETLQRMKETRGAWGDEKYSGFTGAQGMAVQPGEQGKVPTDPKMRELYETVSREEQWIQSKYMPEINRLKQVMGVMQTKPYSEALKRDMHNMAVEQMNKQYELVYQRITDLNAAMSKMSGHHVDVRSRIDWNGTVDQFPATPGDAGMSAIKH